MLQPLGTAYVASLAASLVIAVTVTPALCSVLLTSVGTEGHTEDPWLVRQLKALYRPTLAAALRRPGVVLLAASLGVIAAVGGLASFGRSFLPTFNEGAFTLAAATAPGTPLAESDAMVRRLEERVVASPIVQAVVRRTGRAERDEHAQDVQFSELEVTITPGVDREVSAAAMREAAAGVPGLVVSVGQPISHRIEHMLSGVKTSLAIKVFGEDLSELRRVARADRTTVAEWVRRARLATSVAKAAGDTTLAGTAAALANHVASGGDAKDVPFVERTLQVQIGFMASQAMQGGPQA